MLTVEKRQKIERKIVRRVVRDALHAGYAINVHNGGDGFEFPSPVAKEKTIMEALFATDEERLFLYRDNKRVGWVFFVYGNGGWDVVTDYTTNLEELMGPIGEYADKLSEQCN